MINTRKLTALFTFITVICIQTLAAKKPASQHLDLSLPSVETKLHKSRMRKTTGIPQKKVNSYRDMEYADLVIAKDKLVTQKNFPSAVKYLDQLIKLCNPEDADTIASHRLQIADLFFMQEDYHKASQKYAEFALLHPGNNSLGYSLYKAIISAHNCTLTYDRDQTKTEETLALAESFLKQDHFSQYVEEVNVIIEQCRTKLIDSELSICAFHLNRGSLKAAEKRINSLRTNWLPKRDSLEPLIASLEKDLTAQKDLYQQKINKQLLLTQNNNTKRMTERF